MVILPGKAENNEVNQGSVDVGNKAGYEINGSLKSIEGKLCYIEKL